MRSPRRRAEIFGDSETDSRLAGVTVGDERDVLLGVLRDQRATLELKCAKLNAAEMARRSVEPSTLSLLGLVRHLADVERRWFRNVLSSEGVSPIYATVEEPDADFDGVEGDPELVAEAWRVWRDEVAYADRFTDEAPNLDVSGVDAWRGSVSLRWVLVHMVEEYARHNGHADLLRERIDGAIGV